MLVRLLMLAVFLSVSLATEMAETAPYAKFQLSESHLAATKRHRRIILNFDVLSGDRRFGGRDPKELVQWKFHAIDQADVQIDSVWWCWGEGNQAPWASKTMVLYDAAGYRKWVRDGVDIVKVCFDAAKERGIESFFNFRINGSDNDLGPFRSLERKIQNPQWLIRVPWRGPVGLWNYGIPEVRAFRLEILRAIAERYDHNGISLDFARSCPVLPPGRQWELRDAMTDFMRKFRTMTQEVARRRGHPLLVGARIPASIEGCHYDGLDIETWVGEGLVDVLALGVRSFDIDVDAFRRLTAGTHIKLYPSIDDHHASDGYATPPIEIYRGVASNWWRQGVDGVQTFNFNHAPDFPYRKTWTTHLLAFRELGSPATLRHKNKIFVVQRRGGGHGQSVIPNPENWHTPRHMYINTNLLAALPETLDGSGKGDTMLTLAVGDDVTTDSARVENIALHVLVTDPAIKSQRQSPRLPAVVVATIGHAEDGLKNRPACTSIASELEARLNNVQLPSPRLDDGWIVFDPINPRLLAVGNNLVGLRYSGPPRAPQDQILIEKLELHVNYRER